MSWLALGFIQSLMNYRGALSSIDGRCETESLAPILRLKIGRVETPFPVGLHDLVLQQLHRGMILCFYIYVSIIQNQLIWTIENTRNVSFSPHYIWRTNLHIWVSTVDTPKWHVDLWAACQHTHIRIRSLVVSFVSERSRVWILSVKRILWVFRGFFQSFNSLNWSLLSPFSINRQVFQKVFQNHIGHTIFK